MMFKNPPHGHPPPWAQERISKFFLKAKFEGNFCQKKVF